MRSGAAASARPIIRTTRSAPGGRARLARRELVPVGKSYFGFTDEELKELDAFVRNHTVDSFGPVRQVEPKLVFEVAFDSVHRSTRHKSGVAMRFPAHPPHPLGQAGRRGRRARHAYRHDCGLASRLSKCSDRARRSRSDRGIALQPWRTRPCGQDPTMWRRSPANRRWSRDG